MSSTLQVFYKLLVNAGKHRSILSYLRVKIMIVIDIVSLKLFIFSSVQLLSCVRLFVTP